MKNTILDRKSARSKKVNLKDFTMKGVISRGTYGKVFLATLKNDPKLFAIKTIRKDKMLEDNCVASTENEKNIMFECQHPFILNLDYLFSD